MARQIFAWLAVNCGFGYEAVGAAMGEKAKHHSTVVHARRRVDDIIDGAAPAYGDFIMLAVRCAREIDTIIAKERKAFLSVDFKNWSYAIEKQTEGQRARERDCEGFLAARLGG